MSRLGLTLLNLVVICSLSLLVLSVSLSTVFASPPTWTTQTLDNAGDVGWHTSLALDAISYYDYSNTALKYANSDLGRPLDSLSMIGLGLFVVVCFYLLFLVFYIFNRRKIENHQTSDYVTVKHRKQSGFPWRLDYPTLERIRSCHFSDYETYLQAQRVGAHTLEQWQLVQQYQAPDYATALEMQSVELFEAIKPELHPPDHVDELPKADLPPENKCCVCQLPMEEGIAILRCPSCGITGHPGHFKEWLRTKALCPNCREKVLEKDLRTGIMEATKSPPIAKKECWACQHLLTLKQTFCPQCGLYQICLLCMSHVEYSDQRRICPECKTPLHQRCLHRLEADHACPNPACSFFLRKEFTSPLS
ncbi:MAG: hypothetical protein ACFFDI_01800 [Promethearchaeota archaeon]